MKLKDIIEKSWNLILDHPRISGIGTFFILNEFIQGSQKTNLSETSDFVNLAITYYLAVKLNRMFSIFHTENFRPFIKQLKIYYNYKWFHKDQERLKQDIHKLLEIRETKPAFFSLASLYHQEGNIETALYYYRKGIKLRAGKYGGGVIDPILNKNNPISKMGDRFAYLVSGFDVDIKKIEKNPKDIDYHLSRIAHLYGKEKFKEFKDAVRTSTRVNNSTETRFAYALMADSIKEMGLAEEMWAEGLELLLKKGANFKQIANTRNEVLEFKGSEFFRGLFVFKRGTNRENIQRDYLVNSMLYDSLSEINEEHRTAEPLAFLKPTWDEKYYDITKREDKKNLEELIENGEDVEEHIEQTMISLGLIHAAGLKRLSEIKGFYLETKRGKINIPKYHYLSELRRRLFFRLEFNSSLLRLEELYSRHISDFESFDFLCHGDLYPPNVLEGGTIVDLERANIGNPSLDLADILESSGERSLEEVQSLINIYHRSLTDNSDASISKDDLTRNYIFLDRIHSLMCDIGSKKSRGKTEIAKTNVHRVDKYFKMQNPELRNAFVDYIYSVQPALLS